MSRIEVPVSARGRAGIAAIRAALASRPRDETLSLDERRFAITAATTLASAGIAVDHLSLGGIPVERHVVSNARPGSLLYAHGGAYVIGSAATHRAFAASIAAESRTTLYAVDYRLAPEHRFPAGRDDVVAAYRALIENGDGPVGLVGDSAGGGLMLQVAIALCDASLPMPQAIAVTSPWVDFACAGDSYRTNAILDTMLTPTGLMLDAERYLGSASDAAQAAAISNAQLEGLPTVLIQVGQDEILLSDSEQLHDALAAAGVAVTLERWVAMTHAWHVFRDLLPEAGLATARIGDFLTTELAIHGATHD